MSDSNLDTASQRASTGLDVGARQLIAQALGASPEDILGIFFRDTYSGLGDYVAALNDVWTDGTGTWLLEGLNVWRSQQVRELTAAEVGAFVLTRMPEPDFRQAITRAFRTGQYPLLQHEERVTNICRSRGAPWRFTGFDGFVWTGDQEIERQAIEPARSALADSRFAGGVRSEFESARSELALGTPSALSQCVHQAGCAVESAMKVVLETRGITHDQGATAHPLFDLLKERELVDELMRSIVLGPATPRNRRGGHGAGATAHAVSIETAQAVLASAAVSIAFLRSLLP